MLLIRTQAHFANSSIDVGPAGVQETGGMQLYGHVGLRPRDVGEVITRIKDTPTRIIIERPRDLDSHRSLPDRV